MSLWGEGGGLLTAKLRVCDVLCDKTQLLQGHKLHINYSGMASNRATNRKRRLMKLSERLREGGRGVLGGLKLISTEK